MNLRIVSIILFAVIGICAGCANISSPTGGRRDTRPPKLLLVTPVDSLKNTRPGRIEFNFDEYITVSDAIKEVQISPILSIQPTALGVYRKVVVKIADTLLEDNTTYRLSFGNAIKDLHEGNAFGNYTYTFSTGPYFDSLELSGTITDAATGLNAVDGVIVELYSADDDDSAVVRHKPKYVAKADATTGAFQFKGLPCRRFRIYAIKDANSNLVYDGPPGEMIAFNNDFVWPDDSARHSIPMRLFTEVMDTASLRKDSLSKGDKMFMRTKNNAAKDAVSYTLNVDTTNITKRTFDINKPVTLTFSRPAVVNSDKVSMLYDEAGTETPVPVKITADTGAVKVYTITPAAWKENRVYTLRLAKGFAKDTSGADIMPARYAFRTFDDQDYGKIKVHLPSKYYAGAKALKAGTPDSGYVLMVMGDKDTVYQKTITDTTVSLVRLKPGKYTFRVIADKNGNGKWDTGDLFARLQPEEVIPMQEPLNLKAGWENIVDFEQRPRSLKEKAGAPK